MPTFPLILRLCFREGWRECFSSQLLQHNRFCLLLLNIFTFFGFITDNFLLFIGTKNCCLLSWFLQKSLSSHSSLLLSFYRQEQKNNSLMGYKFAAENFFHRNSCVFTTEVHLYKYLILLVGSSLYFILLVMFIFDYNFFNYFFFPKLIEQNITMIAKATERAKSIINNWL